MPANQQAAATTDVYRAQLLRLRERVTRQLALNVRGVDLDEDLEEQFAAWTEQATLLVELGQREAARMASVYVPAFLRASGVEPRSEPVDIDDHVGTDPFGKPVDAALATVPAVLLWRLGRGDGRPTALASGVVRSQRVTRTAVMGAARSAQAETMTRESVVVGWRRVTSAKPCGACLGLATGQVESKRRPVKVHDSCRCTAEPVLRNVVEPLRRPSGQQLFDRLDPEAQDALFAGTGGAAKAAIVRERGVSVLVDERGGRSTEKRLVDLTT